MEKLLTVEQAGALLNVHSETVRQWLRSGRLRGVKLGHRSWRVSEGALRELASAGRASATTTPEATSPSGTPDRASRFGRRRTQYSARPRSRYRRDIATAAR